jgi:acyl-CoA reductase-like NAD-dependent aldehyde dehydrogenase
MLPPSIPKPEIGAAYRLRPVQHHNLPGEVGQVLGAVIEERSFDRLAGVLERVRGEDGVKVLAVATGDDSEGFFVHPTVVQGDNPAGSVLNLQRWVSPRSIKETFVPATDYRYLRMA